MDHLPSDPQQPPEQTTIPEAGEAGSAAPDESGSAGDTPATDGGVPLTLRGVTLHTRTTTPLPRYSESSLIGALQTWRLGRPSTYAATLGLLCERQLARRGEDGELRPTWQGLAIWALLGDGGAGLIGAQRQAAFEAALDAVERGERRRTDVLRDIWSGPGGIQDVQRSLRRAPLPPIHLPALAGSGLHVIVSPAGVFVQSGARSAQLPACEPHELTLAMARAALDDPSASDLHSARQARSRHIKATLEPRVIGVHPQWGTTITLRTSGSGRYLHAHDGHEERRATIPSTEDASTLSPERAALLLSLNRRLGLATELAGLNGLEVRTGLGRYGPYVRCGTIHRAISEDQAMTLTLQGALTLLREPPRPGSATMSTRARLRRDGTRRGAGSEA